MTKTLTETIGEQATDALHEAIRIAWQAGYDQALLEAQENEEAFIQSTNEGH